MEHPMIDLKPSGTRAKLAILGLAGCGALSLLAAGMSAWTRGLLAGFSTPDAITDATLARLDYIAELEMSFTVAWLTTFLVTTVFFCRWLYRAYGNMQTLARDNTFDDRYGAFTPAGAVWAFFIPIFNLWRPHRAVSDLWYRSAPDETAPVHAGIITAWWASWIVGSIMTRFSNKLLARAGEDLMLIELGTSLSAVASLVMTAAAVAAIVVISGVERRQGARRDWLAALAPGRVSPS